MKNHHRLLLSLVLGAAVGLVCHGFAASVALQGLNRYLLEPVGQIFLRLIFMIVVPMVFSALVIGVYQLGRGHDLSGVAGRTLAFTLLFKLIDEVGPGRTTVITFINPAVAVLLGMSVLGEPFTAGIAVGFPLVLIGSVLATRRSAAG